MFLPCVFIPDDNFKNLNWAGSEERKRKEEEEEVGGREESARASSGRKKMHVVFNDLLRSVILCCLKECGR